MTDDDRSQRPVPPPPPPPEKMSRQADTVFQQMNISKPTEPQDAAMEAEPDQPEVNYRYALHAVLPESIQNLIREALEAAEITPSDSTGFFPLQPAFRVSDYARLLSVLREGVPPLFPLQITLSRVHSDVIGAQAYVAGWKLEPVDAVYTLYNALNEKIESLITIERDVRETFKPVIFVQMGVQAAKFPVLIGHLQQHFDLEKLTIKAVELKRQPVSDTSAVWQSVETFPSPETQSSE